MALIRWEPVAELGAIQNEMNRLFNNLFDQPNPTGRNGARGRQWIPAMDLVETGDHYVLRADLPGLSNEDVNVQLEDNVLTISGERKAEHETQQEGYYRLERAFGGFSRSLTLPEGDRPGRGAGPLRSRGARDPDPQARAEETPPSADQPRQPPQAARHDRDRRQPGREQSRTGDGGRLTDKPPSRDPPVKRGGRGHARRSCRGPRPPECSPAIPSPESQEARSCVATLCPMPSRNSSVTGCSTGRVAEKRHGTDLDVDRQARTARAALEVRPAMLIPTIEPGSRGSAVGAWSGLGGMATAPARCSVAGWSLRGRGG